MARRINLLEIKPHKVSRDLSGYITYIYGSGKTGKTTLASQMPNALLVAWEKGYNAIPGIMAQDVTSWSEMKMIARELKKPEVKQVYKSIVIDTVDIAVAAAEKYVISQAGVDKLADIPWGGGWAAVKKEIEEVFRGITQLGYAVFFISHAKEKTFKRADGTEYNQIAPSISSSYNEIFRNMADIYGYAHQVRTETGSTVRLTLRSPDHSIDAGARFKYMPDEIDFNYESLVEALNYAIDKEAEENDNLYITEESVSETNSATASLDYNDLMSEYVALMEEQDTEFLKENALQITHIIEKVLGKGKKMTNVTPDQTEQIALVLYNLKDFFQNK